MQNEEQRLIDGLFQRLKQTENQYASRDSEAEQHIRTHLQTQPNAPYYMAQSILIQEAAIKQLNNQLNALNEEVNQLRLNASQQKSSGSFLSGLFGGNNSPKTARQERPFEPIPGTQGYAPSTSVAGGAAPSSAPPAARNSFMAGALQTAAGVAGGVLVADLLTGMFHHNPPEEVINIINEPQDPQSSFLPGDNSAAFSEPTTFQEPTVDPRDYDDYQQNDINDNDYFSDDDDSNFI